MGLCLVTTRVLQQRVGFSLQLAFFAARRAPSQRAILKNKIFKNYLDENWLFVNLGHIDRFT
jgi:hypothetical protein